MNDQQLLPETSSESQRVTMRFSHPPLCRLLCFSEEKQPIQFRMEFETAGCYYCLFSMKMASERATALVRAYLVIYFL